MYIKVCISNQVFKIAILNFEIKQGSNYSNITFWNKTDTDIDIVSLFTKRIFAFNLAWSDCNGVQVDLILYPPAMLFIWLLLDWSSFKQSHD